MRQGYGLKTIGAYDKGILRWEQFLRASRWSLLDFVNASTGQQLDVLTAFILDLADVQQVPPSVIANILSAVRFWCKINGFPTLLNQHEDTLKRLLAGLAPTPRQRQEQAKKTKRMPVTIDMLDSIYAYLWKPSIMTEQPSFQELDSMMVCLADHLAFALMLRGGEYIPNNNGERAFEGRDLDFISKKGEIIPLEEALPSLLVGKSKSFSSIRLTLVSNKVDQSGKGHPFFVTKRDSPLAKRVFGMLLHWLALTTPSPQDFLFSRPQVRGNRRKKLTGRMINASLQEAAIRRGLPSGDLYRYSTHSLRAGGATYMDSLGYSREEILKAGRWSAKGGHDLQYRLVSRVNTSGLSGKKAAKPRAPKAATLRDVMSALPSRRSTAVTSHR
jgi:hypothetical protein